MEHSASNPIQSCVNSIGYPNTIESFRAMIEHRWVDSRRMDLALNSDLFLQANAEQDSEKGCLNGGGRLGLWTAPPWFLDGDISFFYHSSNGGKAANVVFRKLRKIADQLGSDSRPRRLYAQMLLGIAARGVEFAERYKGSIFAIGIADGELERNKPREEVHWANDTYLKYRDVHLLDAPLQYERFKSNVNLSQRAITRLTAHDYEYLANLVAEENPPVAFLQDLRHRDELIAELSAQGGWRNLVKHHRPRWVSESQLRQYFLDSFLEEVADSKSSICSEVEIQNDEARNGIVDYTLTFDQRVVPCEAKVVATHSEHLVEQMGKYCGALANGVRMPQYCLLIDSMNLSVYCKGIDMCHRTILSFDSASKLSSEAIREEIRKAINHE